MAALNFFAALASLAGALLLLYPAAKLSGVTQTAHTATTAVNALLDKARQKAPQTAVVDPELLNELQATSQTLKDSAHGWTRGAHRLLFVGIGLTALGGGLGVISAAIQWFLAE